MKMKGLVGTWVRCLNKVKRKSLLYRSKVEYADFCINHVEGCAHGCNFPCYAYLLAKRFGRVKSYTDWRKPKIVENALELLDEEIPKYKDQIKFVHLCFMTDPFMYGYKEVEDLTLKIIEKLNQNDIKCTVLTKGVYPEALADTEKYGENNEYGITLVSLDDTFKKNYEPFSAPYAERIESLKYLHDSGLKTWISMEPYPTPNIVPQNLTKLLNSISFADRIIFGKLNYNTTSSTFPDNEAYYEGCADKVTAFCEKRRISCHIKFGTKKNYNSRTEKLFKVSDLESKISALAYA